MVNLLVADENGQQVVDIIRNEPDGIQVVLLDLTMPIIDGEEALRQIKTI